ncbi:ATP-dependent nuclease [Curtobacterium sp. 'Ferrero']|uniref:ATP-dependent nuclease n=1 Tax=Curtobacterium sp. 'Ferrero' TaxID=2033654 RepID=UPI0020D06FF4|nr:AAA family ATPase [Curtobacterium sp. 'Ferrero']
MTFGLTPEEVQEFHEATGITNNGELPVEISLSRNGASFGVVKPGRGAASHKAKAREIASFIADRLTFVSIPAVRTIEQARGLMNDLSRIRIRELTQSEEYVALAEKLRDLRHSAIDGVGAELTASVQRYLPSISAIQILTTDLERSDNVEDVLVDDGSITSLANKGDGVKSLVTLALIQELARERTKSHSFILLVDEPEAHLHSSAVHELQVLFEDISSDQQVVLATHNPIFVNRDHEQSNILVRANEAKPAKSIAEIRETLGVQLHDNLDSAEVVVLVEGITDVTSLASVVAEQVSQKSDVRNGRVVFKAIRGVGKLRSQITREKSSVSRIIAVLDGDEAGQAEAVRLRELKLIRAANVFVVRDVQRAHSELEDLFLPEAYLPRLNSAFGREFKDSHFQNRGKKWTSNLTAAAASLGIAETGDALTTPAKMAVAESVRELGAGALKAHASENIAALRSLIWTNRTD